MLLLLFQPTATAYTLAVGQGSNTLSGHDLALRAARELALAQGIHALGGQDLVLTYSVSIDASGRRIKGDIVAHTRLSRAPAITRLSRNRSASARVKRG